MIHKCMIQRMFCFYLILFSSVHSLKSSESDPSKLPEVKGSVGELFRWSDEPWEAAPVIVPYSDVEIAKINSYFFHNSPQNLGAWLKLMDRAKIDAQRLFYAFKSQANYNMNICTSNAPIVLLTPAELETKKRDFKKRLKWMQQFSDYVVLPTQDHTVRKLAFKERLAWMQQFAHYFE